MLEFFAIDPNGDFETFFAARENDFWKKGDFSPKLKSFATTENQAVLPVHDTKEGSTSRWSKVIFQQIVAGRQNRVPLSANAYGAPLSLHWQHLHKVIQDQLLDIDPSRDPKVFQGVATCHHYINVNKALYPRWASLRDLEDIALDFETRRVSPSLTAYSDSLTMTSDDWNRVRMFFRRVRKKYGEVLYDGRIKEVSQLPSDLGAYINRAFLKPINPDHRSWQFMSVGLAGVPSDHSWLVAYVSLQRIWDRSVEAWKRGSVEAWKRGSVEAWKRERQRVLQTVKSISPIELLLPDVSSEATPIEIEGPESSNDVDEVTEFHPERIEDDFVVPKPSDGEPLRPTFIVIYEAHNFLPEVSESPLQRKVSDLIATIAAEGRKYGIFLIISTQRPQKIRRGIAAECENIAALRLQSYAEREYLSSAIGVPKETVQRVGGLKQGEALLSGRWIEEPSEIVFAPARTFLGGANVSLQGPDKIPY